MKNGVIFSLLHEKKQRQAVSEIFNNFSTNIGTNLSVALPQLTTDFRQYFDLSILQHSKFDFHLIGVQEIIDSLKSFDQKVYMTIYQSRL